MYKGTINEPIVAKANEPIAFVTVYNDGKCTDIPNDGMTKLTIPGYDYMAFVNVVVIGASRGTLIEMQLYNGDEKIPHAISRFTSIGSTYSTTLNLAEVFHSKLSQSGECACLNVRMNVDCMVTEGTFCVA